MNKDVEIANLRHKLAESEQIIARLRWRVGYEVKERRREDRLEFEDRLRFPRPVSMAKAADMLGISKTTAYRWRREGAWPDPVSEPESVKRYWYSDINSMIG